MKCPRIISKLLLVALLAALGAAQSRAAPVRIDFVGTVTFIDDGTCQCLIGVSYGGTATGYYVYEHPWPDADSSATRGSFVYKQPPARIVLKVGDHEFVSDTAVDSFEIVINNGGSDVYHVIGGGGVDARHTNLLFLLLTFRLFDSSATAISSDSLPTSAPDLTSWDVNTMWILGDFQIKVTVTDIVGVPTAVLPDRPGSRAPDITRVYPNPFSGITDIDYDPGSPGERIVITVYDVEGRRVAILVDDRAFPGLQTVRWDGRDRTGRELPSGVYFLQMITPSSVTTRKAVLIR